MSCLGGFDKLSCQVVSVLSGWVGELRTNLLCKVRDNEIVEAEVKAKGEEKSGKTEVESGLEAMRRAPADFTEGSEAYWMALANASARRVVTFAVLPKSQTAVQRVVAQSALKDVELTEGDHQFLE